ncbi:MAG TPA: AIR synthase-related protein [Nitrososphaerales archaeon]|nr:AIR synthase-related protein [Nitrososphaerales archaeon]
MSRLSLGKIPIAVLNSTFLRMTGASSDAVITPPLAGLDFAALKVDGKYMIISADPVTGVVEGIGRYAISVSANDVATSGNRPQFAESVVLMPEGADAGYAEKIARQMDSEARRIGLSIVGGHTEVTPGLHHPIVAVTAFSFVDGYVSSRDAREGDAIMMSKTAGLEGTAVLGGHSRFLDSLSVVDEATAGYATGAVHAMHDCTEGGVLGAAFEMSLASGLGFELEEKKVPVAPETRDLCRRRGIDPLRLIGSGALLLAVESGKEPMVSRALSAVCRISSVGKFTKAGRTLVRKDGSGETLRKAPEDELWRALARSPGRRYRP